MLDGDVMTRRAFTSKCRCSVISLPEQPRDDHCVMHRPASQPLEDGRYDAFIVWAERRENGIALECTITDGPHRGDVVDLTSSALATDDEFTLVGMPCTLLVTGDDIRVQLG